MSDDDGTVFADVERVIRSSVRVDVAKFVVAMDEPFDGTAAEYVRDRIRQDPMEYLDACSDNGDGVEVTEEWDETTATVYS